MYQDPIIKAYVDLITSKTSNFKKIYQGEPTRLGTSVLPCLLISKVASEVSPHSSSEDEHGMQLNFTVVTDIRKELSTSENDESVLAGVSKLYELIEGRDSNMQLQAGSLLNILRNNQLVSSAYGLRTDLSGATRINYGETLQARDPQEWRIQASITIIATFNQVR